MRHFQISVFVLFLLHVTPHLLSLNVRVIFINKTGMPLDSLMANNVYIGRLMPDSSSRIMMYERLVFDSSGDGMTGQGILIKGPGARDTIRVRSWPDLIFCGTEPYNVVTGGDFLYHIQHRYIDSKHYILFEHAPRVYQAKTE